MIIIDAHLAECTSCREHFRFERALIDNLHALRREHHDVGSLRDRLIAALREARKAPRP
jgi:hypothetical protein